MPDPGWWIAGPLPWGPRETSGPVTALVAIDPALFEPAGGDSCITRGCRSPNAPRSACSACRDMLRDTPVNCALGLAMVTRPDGAVWFCENACMLGFDRPTYRCFDVSGNVVRVSGPSAPPEPPSEEAERIAAGFVGQDPLAGFGFPDPGSLGPGGLVQPGGLAGLAVGQLDFSDLGALFQQITGGQLDVAGIVRALVVMALGQDRVRGALAEIAPGAGDAFAPHFANLVTAQLTGSRELTTRLEAAIEAGTEERAGFGDALSRALLAQLVEAMGEVVRAIVQAAQGIFGPVVEAFRDKIGDLAQGVQGIFRAQLEAQRGRLPRELDAVAGRAIGNALLAGTTAQMAAAGIELFYPTKNLGLGQFVGFIADFAGFRQITGPWFGPTVRAALGNYSQHRADEMFRSEIPSAGEAKSMAAERHIPVADYAAILTKHGLPSWWIQAALGDVYRDPSPREITEMMNDGEAEPTWVAHKLREIGYDDADVERGTRAILLKSSRAGRGKWIAEALAGHRDGRLAERELEGVLRAAGLNATHRDAYLRGARLARRGQIMNRIGTQVVTQYTNDLLSREATAALLVGLGFEVPEVAVRLLEADLRRNVTQVREEQREVEAELRQLTSSALENLKRQFRAGLVDRAQFEVWAEQLGYSAAYVQNVADLELLKGPPSAAEDLPPIGLGAVQEAGRQVARLLEDDVRHGRVDVGAAVAVLGELGIQHDLAGELLGIAQVLGLPVPGGLGIPMLGDDLGRAAFEQILGQVFQQIRHGEGGVGLLEQLLERIGLPAEHRDPLAAGLRELERLFFQRNGA